jgi:hypothetical protein
MLKVPLNADGFYVEHEARPVDFATEGIFLCGPTLSEIYR